MPLRHPPNSIRTPVRVLNRHGASAALVLLGCAACGNPMTESAATPESVLLLENVTVIDGTGAPARAGMSVAVTGERISAVGPAGSVRAISGPGAEIVDASGLLGHAVGLSIPDAAHRDERRHLRGAAVDERAEQSRGLLRVERVRERSGEIRKKEAGVRRRVTLAGRLEQRLDAAGEPAFFGRRRQQQSVKAGAPEMLDASLAGESCVGGADADGQVAGNRKAVSARAVDQCPVHIRRHGVADLDEVDAGSMQIRRPRFEPRPGCRRFGRAAARTAADPAGSARRRRAADRSATPYASGPAGSGSRRAGTPCRELRSRRAR